MISAHCKCSCSLRPFGFLSPLTPITSQSVQSMKANKKTMLDMFAQDAIHLFFYFHLFFLSVIFKLDCQSKTIVF